MTDHREVFTDSGISLEYNYNKSWQQAPNVPVGQIRAYEMSLLRVSTRRAEAIPSESCNKDPRKDVAETMVRGRKSGGILVAVTPCLQVVAISPMYASESLTQILFMVLGILALFRDLSYVLYDNACAVVRHLRKQHVKRGKRGQDVCAWAMLLALHWVIDRLHWCYHRACKDPNSGWFVAGVGPKDHPVLRGIDTEAAEQLFHVANRWQIVLSNTAPVHHELFLLLFAHDHNEHHSCEPAWAKYVAAQQSEAVGEVSEEETLSEPLCRPCVMAPAKKRKKAVIASCEPPRQTAAASSRSGGSSSAGLGLPAVGGPPEASALPAVDDSTSAAVSLDVDFVAVNDGTHTIHSVFLRRDVYAKCGWSFQARARVVALGSLDGRRGLYTCGVCFEARCVYDSSSAVVM